jgi:hypothetical protein
MWYERQKQFVRAPVPASLDRWVEQLQDRDSVLFESIALPSLARSDPSTDPPTGRSKTALAPHRDPVIDLSDDFVSDDDGPTGTTTQLQLRALLDRVHELETANSQKDKEIAQLKKLLEQGKTGAQLAADAQFYKSQYENMKMQFDKLKQALAAEGKVRRVKVKSVCAVKPCASG